MDNHEAYRLANRRVRIRIAFYIHFSAYLAVNILLLIVNLATSTDYLWFKWPLFGWGVGIVFHALAVWGLPAMSQAKAGMVDREMQRQLRRQSTT
jgi:hypothetical protein